MSPIKNEFAPVTFRFGFVESSFASLCEAFQEWFRTIDAKDGLKTEFRAIVAPLGTALLSLEPRRLHQTVTCLSKRSRIGRQFSRTDYGLTTFSALLAIFRFA